MTDKAAILWMILNTILPLACFWALLYEYDARTKQVDALEQKIESITTLSSDTIFLSDTINDKVVDIYIFGK